MVDWLDSTRSQTFDYDDDAPRLKFAQAEKYGQQDITYDAVGNRETLIATPPIGSPTQDTYNYPEDPKTSHRLLSINGGPSFGYNASGSVESYPGAYTLSYNNAGRAWRIGPIDSIYNAAGQRVSKTNTASGETIIFHYDRQGRLLSEMITPGPLVQREYIWLEDLPLVLETSSEPPAVDNVDSDFSTTGTWIDSTAAASYFGTNYKTGSAASYTRDDGGIGTSKTGTWTTVETNAAYFGAYQKSCSSAPTFTWTVQPILAGPYKVWVRWIAFSGVTTSAAYTVTHANGSNSYSMNQTLNSGVWMQLGGSGTTFDFSTSGQVDVAKVTGSCLSADAVMLEPADPAQAAQWDAPGPNAYTVEVRWPAHSTHSSAAVYRVTYAGGQTQDFTKNQKTGGGAWTLLASAQPGGAFTFDSSPGQGVKLLAGGVNLVAADAVRFKPTTWAAHERELYYYHPDHLGTPQKVTDGNGAVVWDAFYEPFGAASLIIEDITQPLRFPGQYFDAETGLHQNWHRDYDPSIGRYLQSDPIGLQGGISTYGYVFQNPLKWIDPRGLEIPTCQRYYFPGTDPITLERPELVSSQTYTFPGFFLRGNGIDPASPAPSIRTPSRPPVRPDLDWEIGLFDVTRNVWDIYLVTIFKTRYAAVCSYTEDTCGGKKERTSYKEFEEMREEKQFLRTETTWENFRRWKTWSP